MKLQTILTLLLFCGAFQSCKNRNQGSIALAAPEIQPFTEQFYFSGDMALIETRAGQNGNPKKQDPSKKIKFGLSVSILFQEHLVGALQFEKTTIAFWGSLGSDNVVTIRGSAFKNLLDLYDGNGVKLLTESTFVLNQTTKRVESSNLVFQELGGVPPTIYTYSILGKSLDR